MGQQVTLTPWLLDIWLAVCMFVCSVFDDAVSSSDCIASGLVDDDDV